jgi:hypothetical protein
MRRQDTPNCNIGVPVNPATHSLTSSESKIIKIKLIIMTTKNQTQDTFHESKRSKEILGKHAMEGVSEAVEKARKAHLKKGGTFIDSFKVPPYKSKRSTSEKKGEIVKKMSSK